MYLETKSVLGTAYISGIYLVITALSGFWFGALVDHHKKRSMMLVSSIVSLIFFAAGLLFFLQTPSVLFKTISSFPLWIFVLLLMIGVIAGNIRNITLPTLVTLLVPVAEHDKANGLSGTVGGLSFGLTSVASGLILANGGMPAVMLTAVICTSITIVQLLFISIPEKKVVHVEGYSPKIDIKGTFISIKAIPGLIGLILFATINNFLGGVYMSLMDAYGLSLVSVQTWGFIWGFLSLAFIVGGLIVAKKGLGKKPLQTMFLANIGMWIISVFFTIQPWIWLLVVGMFLWLCMMPVIEATEQTVIQKVVPQEKQGRVFGFSQSVEQAASPITAFLIGPIAQFIFIPFMTTGRGVSLIGGWFGTGVGRGIALVFIFAGVVGLCITLLAMRSSAYKLLSARYAQ